MLFEPKHVEAAESPNFFKAKKTGMYSNVALPNFWNRVIFTKHSDGTLKLFGKSHLVLLFI